MGLSVVLQVLPKKFPLSVIFGRGSPPTPLPKRPANGGKRSFVRRVLALRVGPHLPLQRWTDHHHLWGATRCRRCVAARSAVKFDRKMQRLIRVADPTGLPAQ